MMLEMWDVVCGVYVRFKLTALEEMSFSSSERVD